MNKKIFQFLLVLFFSYSVSLSLHKITHAIYHQRQAEVIENCINSNLAVYEWLVSDTLRVELIDIEPFKIVGRQFYQIAKSECNEYNNFEHEDSYSFFTYLNELLIGREG